MTTKTKSRKTKSRKTTSRGALPVWNDADDYRSLSAARERHPARKHHDWTWWRRVDAIARLGDDTPEPPRPSAEAIEDFARLSAAIGQRLTEMGVNADDYDGPFHYYDDDREGHMIQSTLERHPKFEALVMFLAGGQLPDGRRWHEGSPDDLWTFLRDHHPEPGTEFGHLVKAIGGNGVCWHNVLQTAADRMYMSRRMNP